MSSSQIHMIAECVPILYCTRTLLSSPYLNLAASRPVHLHTKKRVRSLQHYRRYNTETNGSYDISFDDNALGSGHLLGSDGFFGNSELLPRRRSTLTASERLTFHRIATGSRHQRQENDEDCDLSNISANVNDPHEELNSIFEAAIEFQDQQEDFGRNFAKARDQPKAVESLRDQDEAPVKRDHLRPSTLEDARTKQARIKHASNLEEKLPTAVVAYRTSIRTSLDDATTDAGVWDVLETEVFSMVTQMTTQMAREEEERKPPSKHSRRKSKTPASLDTMQQDLGSVTKAVFSPLTAGSIILPSRSLIAILQEAYTYLNLEALRIWRSKFPASPYTLALLPKIKSMGSISYVLGASTSLYSEVLYAKWSQQQDLYGLADLLQEMQNQGIQFDELTSERSAGSQGEVMKMWWNLRGVKDIWTRVNQLYLEGKAEMRKAALLAEESSTAATDDNLSSEQQGTNLKKVSSEGFRIERVLSDRQVPKLKERLRLQHFAEK
ncbi:uncharacterized protein KY384_006024 [Bacidia gigantensis]|uniref:uncharacterized protein n=1 Tax=Bacidia gigantensis TaxID=2732470 RepID=UPI001D0475F4|nr:uncharacterized protein KY384_006024 [Bacidia gigantensis]KAG8529388.1 hypothetical protein KY384_006024 [Bacidia gigantensis]